MFNDALKTNSACSCRLCDTQGYNLWDKLKSSDIVIDKNKLCDELNEIWG